MRDHWDTWGVTLEYGVVLDLDTTFGFTGRTLLDIGFGHGDTLLWHAERRPQWRVLGVDVYRPGVGAALKKLACREDKVTNVRIVRADALMLLHDHLPDSVLDEVYLCFPEPWPRERDAHRRLFRPLLLDILARRMADGGCLHLVTDVAEYAEHASAVAAAASGFTEIDPMDTRAFATIYAAKAAAAGRAVVGRCFRRQEGELSEREGGAGPA